MCARAPLYTHTHTHTQIHKYTNTQIDGMTYKLRLLPSGIVRKNKISIIGNGVVIDPWALIEEIEEIKSKGVDVNINNFIISEAANLILPFHREMDEIL